MRFSSLILHADVAGNPIRWIGYERAACLLETDRVVASFGEPITLRGGTNARTGIRSELTFASIFLVKGAVRKESIERKFVPRFSKRALLRRDQMCMYCGLVFPESHYTIDHVLPSSRGGATTFENTVLACRSCNQAKGDLTPEEWARRGGHKLLAVPYTPNRAEYLWLQNRRVLADQQAWLHSRFPRHSALLRCM